MNLIKSIVLMLFLSVFVSSCGDKAAKPDGEAGEAGAQTGLVGDPDSPGGNKLAGAQKVVSYKVGAINDPANVLFERVVYFDYDSSKIRQENIDLLGHHGKYLSLNPGERVRIEGHTDERGSREYNIALSERRALAVKKLLLFQGAAKDQITVISYGEEKPDAFGHDEEAWSMNRRAELVYGDN